jgi:hypothetical protein
MKYSVLLAASCLALSFPAEASAQPILGAEAEYARVAAQARAYFAAGRYSDALMMTRDAHAFIAGELGPRHVLALKALNDIAVIHQLQGQFDLALPIALEAAGGLEREAGPDHAETLNALANLAQLQIGRNDMAAAEPLLRRVIDGRTRTLGAADEATLNALLEYAVFMKRAGRLREIAAQLTRGAATAQSSFGADSAIALDLAAASREARGEPAPNSEG